MITALVHFFLRDLDRMADEVKLYNNERALWLATANINNPAGNLILHVCGNLQYFIGSMLGESAYIRNRTNEFETKNVSLAQLLNEIEETKKTVRSTLTNLKKEQLSGKYPGEIPFDMSVEGFLIHLLGHLNYHLGQINYHRRILDLK